MSFKLTSIGDTKCPDMAMLQRLYKDTSQYPNWDISSANWDMNEKAFGEVFAAGNLTSNAYQVRQES